jgi:hypothetical protein
LPPNPERDHYIGRRCYEASESFLQTGRSVSRAQNPAPVSLITDTSVLHMKKNYADFYIHFMLLIVGDEYAVILLVIMI